MNHELLLIAIVTLPALLGLISYFLPISVISRLRFMFFSVCLHASLGIYIIYLVFTNQFHSRLSWLMVDALSAYNLLILIIVFLMSSLYCTVYFKKEIAYSFQAKESAVYCALWLLALSCMTLTLIVNHLALMWVSVEGITLSTAFLICTHKTRVSMEATWKYLILCSTGVAFAFIGTLFIAAAAQSAHLDPSRILLWTYLSEHALFLDPTYVKLSFIFVLVGYGTKAGIAPMHTWLPDAYSQAPAPVAALSSGFMINAALYCITRFLPIVEKATGKSAWALSLLLGFGLLSILLSATFIAYQKDLKRLFAYSSIEHMGILCLGFGLGALGTFAALFHTLNHAVAKSLSFFAAGRIHHIYGSDSMAKVQAVFSRTHLWGLGLMVGVLALLGMAPFALFMSELSIIQSAVQQERWVPLVLFIVGLGIVFIAILKYILAIVFEKEEEGAKAPTGTQVKASFVEYILVLVPIGLLLLLGFWMPSFFYDMIQAAANIIHGGKS